MGEAAAFEGALNRMHGVAGQWADAVRRSELQLEAFEVVQILQRLAEALAKCDEVLR